MKKYYKWIFVSLFIVIIAGFGFTFTVREGSAAIVSRFGEVREVYTESGLHMKLPWPFEKIITYDIRSQYMDSGLVETLTNDKKNIILQVYAAWNIEDPLKFYTSIGSNATAEKYLGDLIANAKNSTLGKYPLSALVSTDPGNVKIDDISREIGEQVARNASDDYGIRVEAVKMKQLTVPGTNISKVYQQMIAERKKYSVQLISEGERDAAIIIGNAKAEAAQIKSEGKLKAAGIDADTERMVAEIYSEAYNKDSQLFTFLRKLIALENSVNENTIIIMKGGSSPFDILDDSTRK
ncbi:MAG TPA: protease modulator HflC [Bacillota bacterium]|nr:protease modulator HflC [Bacillota bacterium]